MPVGFADISHYQGVVDLAAYKAAGFDRIAMKATGGALDGMLRFADATFPARWALAGDLGLARVAYHFARNNNPGADEFAWFWSQVLRAGGAGPQDVLCYDTEDNRPGMVAMARRRAIEFTGRAVAQGHAYGWIYSGRWYLAPGWLVAADLPPGWRNLWISDTTPAAIELPPGWTADQLVACQYTDHASLPGIPSTDADFVIREWIDMTSPSNWSPADKAVVRDLVRAELGYAVAAEEGTPNSVYPHLSELETKLDAIIATLAAPVDVAVDSTVEVVKAIAGEVADEVARRMTA